MQNRKNELDERIRKQNEKIDRQSCNLPNGEMPYCIYCDREVSDPNPPPFNDSVAWALAAKDHGKNCEWIATRAHRIEETK